ncbi:unnamed protein product [Amaranthus hypochondriacus]
MGSIPILHAFILSLLIIVLASSISTTANSAPYSAAPHQAPSPAPSHHHHHHHNLSKPPTYQPVQPPTKAPVSAPYSKPSSKAPAPYSKPPAKAPAPYSKPPSKAPVSAPHSKPPSKAPAPYSKPPAKAPALAPHSMPPRKLVAVEGVIYCKNCSYAGVDTLLGASPLSGATVELRCRNTKYMIKKTATTDKNGFFFLQAPKYITTYGAHKCRVFLVKRPKDGGPCSHATNLNGGVSGAFLFLNKKLAPPSKPLPFSIFTVGPFAFEPSKCFKH